MTSETEICNMALSQIGGGRIDSLEEASAEGRACALWYPIERDRLLDVADWTWNRVRRSLTALAENPRPEAWAYAYQKPVGVKRVLSVYSMATGGAAARRPYEIEGDIVFSDVPSAILRGSVPRTDPAVWSAAFRDALAWAVAARVAMPVTSKEERMQLAQRMADDALDAALGWDADLEDEEEDGGEPPHLAARG